MEYGDEFERFLATKGKRGELALQALMKVGVELRATFDDPVGKLLISEDILRFEDLLHTLLTSKLTDDETAELRYIFRRLEGTVAKIKAHTELVSSVRSAIESDAMPKK